MGRRRSVGDHSPLAIHRFLEHADIAPLGNERFVRDLPFRGDDQATLALGFLAEGNDPLSLRKDGGFLGLPRLKEVRNPRQTTGDVPGL